MVEDIPALPDNFIHVTALLNSGRAAIGTRLNLAYFESDMGTLHGKALLKAEREAYGLDHAEAGAELLALWNFPAPVCRAVAEHHDPAGTYRAAQVCAQADAEVHRLMPVPCPIEEVETLIAEATCCRAAV